jgi:tetratricopeptide (TPR) repeat protein
MDETTTDPAEVSTETDETTDLAGQESSTSGGGAASVRRVDEAEVATLRGKLAAAQARPHEYVKLLVALGDALGDPAERVEKYREAANLYVEKGNKAEATKVYEKIFETDPSDGDARGYLRDAYETQRKYDKLVELMMAEARALDPGPEQAEAYKQAGALHRPVEARSGLGCRGCGCAFCAGAAV